MIQVRAPNGTIVQFPDGTAPTQINSVMQSYHDAQTHAAQVEKVPGSMALRNGQTFNHAADLDAATAAMKTGAMNLVGQGPGYGMADAWRSTKAVDQKVLQSYADQHPFLNTAANIIGGVVNPASLLGGEYVGAAKGLLPTMARAAAVGAAEGGTAGGIPGAVTGAVLAPLAPVAGAAAGRVGAAAGGIARNVQRGLGLAKPQSVATRRLSAALAKDIKAGVDPQANLTGWKAVSRPTLADVAGENVRATVRDAGTLGPARQTLANYERMTNQSLQPNAQQLASNLTPNDARPASAIAAGLDSRVAAASTPPVSAQPGHGGLALSQALNDRATQAKAGVDAAYASARAASPEQAQLVKAALPPLAASVRDAVRDFAPSAIPNVRSVLGRLDTLSSPTARDLFEARSQLGNLRVGAPTPETAAASRAVSALDGEIDAAHAAGQFTGDPNVIGLWRNANGLRRAYGQQFESGDLIHDLTAQDWRGGARNLVVAPEDASNHILGRSPNSVAAKPNLTRDFGRVVDLLGEDHPAIQAVRHEAAARLLGADAGTPEFGNSYLAFQRNNPAAGNLILPDLSDPISQQRLALSQAATERQALQSGGSIARAAPDTYAASFAGADPASQPAQTGARQAITDLIGAGPEGATGAMNRLGTAPNAGDNLALTFGPQAADDFRTGLAQEVTRARNADWMAPQLGSKTFSSGQDAHGGLFGGVHGLVMGAAKRMINGAPLSDAERAAIIDPAIGDLTADRLRALLAQPSQASGLFGSQYGVAPLALMGGQAAAQ